MNGPEHINGGPPEDWTPRERILWASVHKLPPGYKIISDHEMMVMANAMNQQTALNRSLASDNRELFDSLMELRNAAAAALRVIAAAELSEKLGVELRDAGVKNGFGKRAEKLIARLAR